MRPSSRFTYALRALVDLTLHQGVGPVTVAAIARRQQIPVHSLEQLFNRLRRKGLVAAERGPRGGYRLKRSADEIPVRAIFEVLEQYGTSAKRHTDRRGDPARAVWQQVEKAVQTTLDATTLGALAAQISDQSGSPIQHRFTFHI